MAAVVVDALAPRASAAVFCPTLFQLGSLVILPVVTELLSWWRVQAAGGLEWIVLGFIISLATGGSAVDPWVIRRRSPRRPHRDHHR
jgi:hypothetical protein